MGHWACTQTSPALPNLHKYCQNISHHQTTLKELFIVIQWNLNLLDSLRDWKNLFIMSHTEVCSFTKFYYCWGEEYCWCKEPSFIM